MPYSSICEIIDEQFNEKVGETSINYIIKTSSQYYEDTERDIIQNILHSPFIHADETSINIKGEKQYVWTFTDGKYVVFKLLRFKWETDSYSLNGLKELSCC